jgi:hypothetical protein
MRQVQQIWVLLSPTTLIVGVEISNNGRRSYVDIEHFEYGWTLVKWPIIDYMRSVQSPATAEVIARLDAKIETGMPVEERQMFTKQHYEMLATFIREEMGRSDEARDMFGTPGPDVVGFAVRLSARLKKDNPNFQTDRFLKACGCVEVEPGQYVSNVAEWKYAERLGSAADRVVKTLIAKRGSDDA